jgi:MoaA/NifB/PqqE/SkfB family radical SAM enzyme
VPERDIPIIPYRRLTMPRKSGILVANAPSPSGRARVPRPEGRGKAAPLRAVNLDPGSSAMDAAAVMSSFDIKTIEFCKRAFARATRRGGRLRGGSALGGIPEALAKLTFQRGQAHKRAVAARSGRLVPPILIASVTRRCNLDCAGCYAKALRPAGAAGELSDERFLELFEEAKELGVSALLLAGGEPLLRRSLLEKTAALGGIIAPVFTNGTLVDREWIEILSSGSLVPIFSIEGEAGFTAARRGGGVHEAVLEGAARMRERGALFGLSVTVTSRNFGTVLAPAFLEQVDRLGAAALFLIEYVPAVGGTEDLALGNELHAALAADERLDGLPYPVLRLPGDEEAFGGCMAAGRGFIHLAPDGRIEACPFAPFSDCSAATGSLAEALESPLMRAIRERHHELTESGGGCALAGKDGWIASLSACAAKPVEIGAA